MVHFYDESPNSEMVPYNSMELKGQNLMCFTRDECISKLRILRAASTMLSMMPLETTSVLLTWILHCIVVALPI